MSEKPVRILLVEDDPDYVEIVRLCLEEPDAMGLSYDIDLATRLAEALQKLAVSRYDAAIVDLGLPDASGLESVRAVAAAAPEMPLLVSTNLGDERAALEAMRLGAQDFMIKASSDSRLLKRSIRYAIERRAVHAQRDEIIRAAADGMVVVDAAGKVRFLNAASEAALGRKAASLLGRPFPYPARPGDVSLLDIPRPDGSRASVEIRVTRVTWNDAPACLACLRDVTELRRVDQLKAQVAERERLDALKDQWIGTLSHELRNPLTIIKGAVADLDEGLAEPLQPQQRMLVDLARRQTERVVKMIGNLLDLSRLESGSIRAELKTLDPCDLTRRVIADLGQTADERALRIEAELPPRLRCAADGDLLAQLLVNLVDNALRFARSRVLVRLNERDGRVLLEVEDDGAGIPLDRRELLFTRFAQIEGRKGQDYKGTGLGLAICKEIAALHGGGIEVKSEPGRGATFVVGFPVDGRLAARGASDQAEAR